MLCAILSRGRPVWGHRLTCRIIWQDWQLLWRKRGERDKLALNTSGGQFGLIKWETKEKEEEIQSAGSEITNSCLWSAASLHLRHQTLRQIDRLVSSVRFGSPIESTIWLAPLDTQSEPRILTATKRPGRPVDVVVVIVIIAAASAAAFTWDTITTVSFHGKWI